MNTFMWNTQKKEQIEKITNQKEKRERKVKYNKTNGIRPTQLMKIKHSKRSLDLNSIQTI